MHIATVTLVGILVICTTVTAQTTPKRYAGYEQGCNPTSSFNGDDADKVPCKEGLYCAPIYFLWFQTQRSSCRFKCFDMTLYGGCPVGQSCNEVEDKREVFGYCT